MISFVKFGNGYILVGRERNVNAVKSNGCAGKFYFITVGEVELNVELNATKFNGKGYDSNAVFRFKRSVF